MLIAGGTTFRYLHPINEGTQWVSEVAAHCDCGGFHDYSYHSLRDVSYTIANLLNHS